MAVSVQQLPPWVTNGLAGMGALLLGYGLVQGLRTVLLYTRSSDLPRYLHCSTGSWALVTGASDGIGRAFAEELLLRGFNVVLHGRNEAKLHKIADELSRTHQDRKLEVLVADATNTELNFVAIRRQMEDLPGKLTILINNVGGIHSQRTYQTLDRYTPQELMDCINANATFTTVLTATLLPLLKRNGPSLILNSGSIVTMVTPPYISTYVGTKGYIHAWASSLRLEIKAQGFSDLVEVLTVAIGNTASRTNAYQEAGATLTSKACAKACLDRVGCGLAEVVPHPRYLLTVLPTFFLPASIVKTAAVPFVKKRYLAEEVSMSKGNSSKSKT